jgi:ribonuclease VapC
MIVVHSSAVLTLLERGAGFEALAAKLTEAGEAAISPVSAMDALMTLSRNFADPGPIITVFLRQSRIALRPVDATQAYWARHGFLNFGSAVWTLADCFAYGAAKALEAPILATTDIFAKSDLRMA